MQKARSGLAQEEAATHRHRIIQGLEGHGGDPKSNGKAMSDFEQRGVPTGVWRTMERTREDAGTLQSRQARQTTVQERGGGVHEPGCSSGGKKGPDGTFGIQSQYKVMSVI